MFFTAACCPGFPRREGIGVGKTKPPPDPTFGVGDTFAAGYGGKIDGLERTAGSTA